MFNKPSSAQYYVFVFTSEHFIFLFLCVKLCSYCNVSNVKDYREQSFKKLLNTKSVFMVSGKEGIDNYYKGLRWFTPNSPNFG